MKDSTRRTMRTIVATVLGLAVAAPEIYRATGHDPAQAAGWLASVLAVCAIATRVMAIRSVDQALSRVGLGSAHRDELLDEGPGRR